MSPETRIDALRSEYERALRVTLEERLVRLGLPVPEEVEIGDVPRLLEQLTVDAERERITSGGAVNEFLQLQGAAGSGKGTIGRRLVTEHGLTRMPRVTDRASRPDEVEGVDYVFVSADEFTRRLAAGEFIGTPATTYGERRGISRTILDQHLSVGRPFLIEGSARTPLDLFAAGELTRDHRFLSVFLLTPSFDELVRRLRTRSVNERASGGEEGSSEEQVRKRIEASIGHVAHSRHVEGGRSVTDIYVVNDRVEEATTTIRQLFR